MSSSVSIDVFAEDTGHSALLRPMLSRLASEIGSTAAIKIRSAVGGSARALDELRIYIRMVEAGGLAIPDMIVICIDANCATYPKKRAAIEAELGGTCGARAVIACPDPHVEKWYLADVQGFFDAVGVRPKVPRRKCARDAYKNALSQAIVDAGHVAPLGGIEFADEIVGAMDFHRAGKNERSLARFVSDARAKLKSCSVE